MQPGDEPVPYFTYWKDDLFHMEQNDKDQCCKTGWQTGKYPPRSILERLNGQMPCYITYTTQRTAALIRANLHKSPLYSGIIQGIGPRYCPSIEDKIVRFSEKERHQIFLEPEGIETDEIYVNGFSTSLPFEVQVELVRTIIGCEACRNHSSCLCRRIRSCFSYATATDVGNKNLSQPFLSRSNQRHFWI